jgi:hypothetical protein
MAARARGSRLGRVARWSLVAFAALLVVWMVASGFMLWRTASSANAGLDALERAQDRLNASALLRGRSVADLRGARSDFAAAHDRADSAVLAPWRWVPLLGSNVSSIEALTGAAERVAAVGERAARASAEIVARQPADGPERLALLTDLQRIAARAERSLARVDLGPDFFLARPIGDARARFQERLVQLRNTISDARQVAAGTRQLLAGPRRYLVLAANNAEMRAGSGMFLSVGVATFADGAFTIGEMRSAADFNLATRVALPPDLETLWGFTPLGRDWRYLAMSPRFEANAPIAVEMWQAATGETVDGVLAVDPVTLQALLRAQGTVTTGDRTVSADDVVEYLLRGQYDGVGFDEPDQTARRDQLSVVARAAVDTLTTRPWDVGALVRRLAEVGRGRHVLAWAADPVEQRAWEAAGIAGTLDDTSLLPAVLNTGGNKLDPYLRIQAELSLADRTDGVRDVTIELKIRNEAPEGLPPYIGGPNPATDLVEGEYQGIVTVNTPGVGSLPGITGAEPVLVTGADGDTKVVGALVRLLRGEERTITIRFVVPASLHSIEVEPSARVPAIAWTAGANRWEDTAPQRVEW